MIGKLKGIVDSVSEDHAILDVQGVGYVAFCSEHVLRHLPPEGEAAMLYIETHVREDHLHLYGFQTAEEQAWFRLLTTVQGVGNRMALALMSVCSLAELSTAIAAQDKTTLTRASGVGPKLATRIVSELKDKAPMVAAQVPTPAVHASKVSAAAPATAPSPASGMEDVVSALVNLGYGRSEAYQAVARVKQAEPELDEVAAMIPKALKELAHA